MKLVAWFIWNLWMFALMGWSAQTAIDPYRRGIVEMLQGFSFLAFLAVSIVLLAGSRVDKVRQ